MDWVGRLGAAAASFCIVGASAALAQQPPNQLAEALASSAKTDKVKGDKAQIEALEQAFVGAFNAKDVGRIMECYAGDGLFVFDVTPPRQHVGWADYRRDWQALFRSMPGPIAFELSDLSVTVVGSVAYGHSIQTLHAAGADGAKSDLVVRVTDVYRKIGGQWLIVQEHVSVPVDLRSGRADLLSRP
jgi:uncharacterized protein (TIGR02246 family)